MSNYFYLFFAAGAGALLRISTNRLFEKVSSSENTLILSTVLINLLGSFLIGFLFFHEKIHLNPAYKILLISSFLGSFTTFSTHSLQALELFLKGKFLPSFLYLFLIPFLGFLFCFLGKMCVERLYGHS